jgi:putative OPT family oligopeptide transporter
MDVPTQDPVAQAPARATTTAELTVRGMLLGAVITVVFMAANIYMGLKTGMTFSSSIPAAVISMAVIRLLPGGGILENNMVQTQASAAGTLCNVILVLPSLVMVGHWSGFPFWQTAGVCLLGGLLGVMYSIPLRRALVVESDLPFPEGQAAAEVLRSGSSDDRDAQQGLRDLATGGGVAAMFSLCTNGFRVLGEGMAGGFSVGHAVFRVGTGFSLALLGVGYLVGIGAAAALLLGVGMAWGVAVPLLTGLEPGAFAGAPAEAANTAWTDQVRLIGAGIIAIGSIWTVIRLARPMVASVRHAMHTARNAQHRDHLPQSERDIPILWVAGAAALFSVPMAALCAWFAAPDMALPITLLLGIGSTVFVFLFGFLMATATGYMAGLLGSSSSPISGVGILTIMVVSLILSLGASGGQHPPGWVIGLALFVSSLIVTIASIANDNLQDLKTGQQVGATPWRQQVALMIGVIVGASVIPPLLDLLSRTYGFVGEALPPGMDPSKVLQAPQASLVATIGRGILEHRLPWSMVLAGVAVAVPLLALEEMLRRRGRQFPVLTVGIGVYLPPSVSLTIATGGLVGWAAKRANTARRAGQDEVTGLRRRGVLLASGFLVGESFVGVLLAAADAGLGGGALTLVGPGFAPYATAFGLAGFLVALVMFYRAVSRPLEGAG